MKRGENPASWPHFYVRWQPAGVAVPTTPALTLDILPTATAGEFRVYLRGQILPNAVVIFHHAAKETEFKADAEGRVRLPSPAPGLSILTCNHKETLPGFAAGISYQVTSHNTALSWRQP